MILVVDIGNTNISIGIMDGDEVVGNFVYYKNSKNLMNLEYALILYYLKVVLNRRNI